MNWKEIVFAVVIMALLVFSFYVSNLLERQEYDVLLDTIGHSMKLYDYREKK